MKGPHVVKMRQFTNSKGGVTHEADLIYNYSVDVEDQSTSPKEAKEVLLQRHVDMSLRDEVRKLDEALGILTKLADDTKWVPICKAEKLVREVVEGWMTTKS